MTTQNYATAAGQPNMIGGMSKFYETCQAPEILEIFRCNTFVDAITTQQRLQGLIKTGTEYTYNRLSDPIVHDGYDTNSEFASPSTPVASECKIRLGYNAYTHEKLDTMQLKRMVNEEVYRRDRTKRHGAVLAQKHQSDFMCWLASQVHPCNEGKTAGASSGMIDLGSMNSPILLNPRNVLSVFTLLDQALNEHNLPMGNKAVVINAPILSMIKMSTGMAIANTGAGFNQYINGLCNNLDFLPCGNNAYMTNCLLPVKNANNQMVVPIYYLWKDAIDTAHGMVDEYSGIFESDKTRSVYSVQRDFITYGFANIYCQGVARAWVAIDPDWQSKLPGGSCA